MRRVIMQTGDGSASVYLPDADEHYHSKFGALQESRHVFIDAGLTYLAARKSHITILEVGFGTGLNAYLTYLFAVSSGLTISYHAVEPFPLEQEIVDALNYPQLLGIDANDKVSDQLHNAPWIVNALSLPHFQLHKYDRPVQDIDLSENVDLVYFDAFAPRVQPELWQSDLFRKIYDWMNPGGVLVTYCAKGEVKRQLRSAGFTLEALPGPPGKREMTRAFK